MSAYMEFQFHLVRLKALAAEEDYPAQIFQFHLVRLKVYQWKQELNSYLFQFHLVRLKACTRCHACYL